MKSWAKAQHATRFLHVSRDSLRVPHQGHVHERSAEFWNYAFVSGIVLEYKATRNLLPYATHPTDR